jgi:hypothetical protein
MDSAAFPGLLAPKNLANRPGLPDSSVKQSKDASRTLAIIESFGYK